MLKVASRWRKLRRILTKLFQTVLSAIISCITF
jgi:hypothetical protein